MPSPVSRSSFLKAYLIRADTTTTEEGDVGSEALALLRRQAQDPDPNPLPNDAPPGG